MVQSDGPGTLGPGEALQQSRVPPLNFSLEGSGTQACAVCQNLSGNPAEDRAPPCLSWHSSGTGCPSGYLEDTPGGWSTKQPRPQGTTPFWFWPAAMLSVAPPDHKSQQARRRNFVAGWPASWAFAVASGGRVGTTKRAESQASEDQATCFSLPPSLPGGNLQGPSGFERRGDRKRH